MSFGFSAGDFAAVGQLIWTVFRACKDAPGEFQELSRELNGIHAALHILEDEAKSPTSLLNRRGTSRKPELDILLKNIKEVLRQIEDIVKRYHSLGKDQKRTWDRVKFATEHLATLRGKLSLHANAVELFNSSLSASSLARIEGILDELVRDIKTGKKEPTVISTSEEDDEVAWNKLERELVGDGITKQNVECHKEAIREYLKKLMQENTMGNGYGSEASLSDTFDELELENESLYQESCESSPSGQTSLHIAAESGHETVVRMMLKEGADVAVKDGDGQTALYKAAESGHETVVRMLLKKGADIAVKDGDGQTALHRAAENGHKKVVRLLLMEGADVAVEDWFKWTALHPAAKGGHETVVRLLLEKGADVAAQDHIGRTALHLAAENGHETVVRLLLGRGADGGIKDNVGRTPLFWAAENGHEAVVQLLQEKGMDVAAKDNIGRMALHRAAEKGKEAAVRLLLEKGVDVTTTDMNERTALHWAAENGHEGMVRLLLQNGADVSATDGTGRTVLNWAAENAQEAMVRLLIRATIGGTNADAGKTLSLIYNPIVLSSKC